VSAFLPLCILRCFAGLIATPSYLPVHPRGAQEGIGHNTRPHVIVNMESQVRSTRRHHLRSRGDNFMTTPHLDVYFSFLLMPVVDNRAVYCKKSRGLQGVYSAFIYAGHTVQKIPDVGSVWGLYMD